MLMTVIEYAQTIKKSRFTVYRWVKENKLPKGVKAEYICGRLLISDEDKRDE